MRDMSTAIETAVESSNVPFLVLVELDFVEGTERYTNAGSNFIWDGHVWYGTSGLGTISALEEGQDLQEYGCTLTLSGISAEHVAKCLGAGYQGRSATIWMAPLSEDFRILEDPIVIFKGRMDTMPIQLGSEASIQITIESKLVDWERPRVRRYNNEDQIAEYPTDRGFEYVTLMVEKELVWGKA